MELVRWDTPISDCESLYFTRLFDDGEGRFLVEAGSGETYEVVLGGYCGPYIISDEEFLTKYWELKEKEVGWTFIVQCSDLGRCFPGVIESADFKHYVVSTADTCLEVLSERPPLIQKIK